MSKPIDGDQWCVLRGENLAEGTCGFGDTPFEELSDFDINVLLEPK